MSPRGKESGFTGRDVGLSGRLREHGCPMMDDTQWDQSPSGEYFLSPGGILTAALWLPCVSASEGPVLPGTCAACVAYNRAVLRSAACPSEDGT